MSVLKCVLHWVYDCCFSLVCSTRDGTQGSHASLAPANLLKKKNKKFLRVLVPGFCWVHKGYQEGGVPHSFAGRDISEWQNRVLCCKLPSLPTIDGFGERSNLILGKILCNVYAAVWPGMAQHLGNLTQLMSWPMMMSFFLSVCICEKSAPRGGRFILCKGGEWTQEAKATFLPPPPKFQSDISMYYSVCSFTIHLTDDVSCHGNMIKLQSGTHISPLRLSLSFLTPALIKRARTGDGRHSEVWGRLA